MSVYVTIIFIFWVEVPLLAVIIALPFAFAVTFPVLETVATEELELFHVTVLPVGVTTAPSFMLLPLVSSRVR